MLLVIISIWIFIPYLQDLPNVLKHHTEVYKGKCEIVITSGKHSELVAVLGDKNIGFSSSDYPGVKEGNYYCKVEYFPHTETGDLLQLYKSNDGQLLKIK